MSKPRVIIIGGGFGGLTTAQNLRNANVDITLIDRTNHHLFQPLLYQVALAALSPGDIASPIRGILRNQNNVNVVMEEVTAIDRERRVVRLRSGDFLPFDILVLAPGNAPSYFGHDNWAKRAPGLKSIDDALTIRQRILMSFEAASRCKTSAERAKYLTFAVVGGGPTGVECAGSIAEIGRQTMAYDYRLLAKDEIKVYLIESGPRVLGSYSQPSSERAQDDLRRLGVKVLPNTRVTAVEEDYIEAGDLRIETVNVIWAAGNKPSSLLKSLDSPTAPDGRMIVHTDCSLPTDPYIFVIGDAAAFKDERTGKLLPAVAQPAMQQGAYVANVIRRQLPRDWRKPFVYFDRGNMATIGRAKAILEKGNFRMAGLPAWLAWCFVHVAYLIGFRNRFRVMAEWMWYYITFRPGARLIYHATQAKRLQEGLPAEALLPPPTPRRLETTKPEPVAV